MSVTIVIGKRHLLAGLSLLILTALVSLALVAPAVSDATTTYVTRVASCAGLNFEPDASISFTNIGTARISSDQNDHYFRCNASLPTRAIVTKVQFTIYQRAYASTISCQLVRTGLSATTTTSDVVHMATVTSGFANLGALVERASDATITDAIVDNLNYAYFLECDLGSFSGGIIGGDVIYKISTTA